MLLTGSFSVCEFFSLSISKILLTLAVLAATEFVSKVVLKRGIVSSYKPASRSYATCFNKNALPLLADLNVRIEAEIHKIINVSDIELTLKAAGICFLAYVLTSAFSLYSLLVAFVVLAFTGPVTYHTYKSEIDTEVSKRVACAKSQACKVMKQAETKAKPYMDCAAKKVAPITKHLEGLLPDTLRTAGSNVTSTEKTFGTGADESMSISKEQEKAAVSQANVAAQADSIATHKETVSVTESAPISTTTPSVPVAAEFVGVQPRKSVSLVTEPVAVSTGATKVTADADTLFLPAATLQVVEDIKAATEAGPLQ